MENYLKQEFLDKLRDDLLNCSLYRLNTGKDSHKFSQCINDMVNVTHLFPADYIGLEGSFDNKILIKLWYFYRKKNNIMLDTNPIKENILGFDIDVNEEELEIYHFLKPFFQELSKNNKLLVVSSIELTESQINNYTSLVKQIQKSTFNITIDDLGVDDDLYNGMNLEDIIKQLNEYNANYVNVGRIQNQFTITSYNNSKGHDKDKEPFDFDDDKITILKAFVV